MNVNGSFGEWLGQRRRALDLTQVNLADQVGCSVMTLRKIERDVRRPSRQIAERLADVLAIAPEQRAAFVAFARKSSTTPPAPSVSGQLAAYPDLPTQLTQFVGRPDELAHIAECLADPSCRLLTLVGPGGIGKTRLALQAAGEQARHFAHGIVFVPLEAVGTPDLVAAAIAGALKISLNGPLELNIQIVNYLCEKHLLLVMDNLEHLLDGVALISEILASAPKVKFLATSRETLNLQEEWLYPVKAMRLPESDQDDDPERYSAVQLFVKCARRARPDFSLAVDKASVQRICQMVEGMPLALEMTAAWLKRLPASEIVQHLERGLDILESPARNVPERHRSMRAVFEHSWILLTDAERKVFKKLSVFRGGFRTDAAEAVAEASLGILSALVDKSLLRVDGTGRYDVHELLRQYGEEQLQKTADVWDTTREAHCRYYTRLLEQGWPRLTGNEYKEAFADIDTELNNVRSSWNWAVSHTREAEIEASVKSLWLFYDSGNRFQEGEQMFCTAAAALKSAGPQYAELRAKVLVRQGALCESLDFFDKARLLLEESLGVLQPTDAPEAVAFGLFELGITVIQQIGPDEAVRNSFQRSLALYRNLNSTWGIASTLDWLGVMYRREATENGAEDDWQKARDYTQEALALFQQLGNLRGIAEVSANISGVACLLGDYVHGWQNANESLRLFKELGIQWGIAYSLRWMGKAACGLGNYSEARHCAFQALLTIIQFHLTRFGMTVVYLLAEICLECGETERAYELLSLVDQQRQKAGAGGNRGGLQLLAKLADELPSNLVAAVERGKRRDFDATLQELVVELSRDSEPVPSPFPTVSSQPLLDALSDRELEVLRLVAEGLSNAEIAARLVLALSTVKWYLNVINTKLHVASRTQAVTRARQLSLLN